jgi:4-hydroxybenzoate polyprenyltransferase
VPSRDTTQRAPIHDAPPGNWVDRLAPDWLKPYARLARWDRPIGWWLLLWPCWWSAALAALAAGAPFPNPWHLFLFLVGAIMARGMGCTYNDLVDREIDAKVARTRTRPLPSGAVTPPQAFAFLALQGLVGVVVLLQFNAFAVGLGLASLVVVAAYPYAKRVTSWPQAVLGLAFSWGALMGWAAAFGRLDTPAFLLYAGAIAWTIGYDTVYALQDREDDAVIGVRSTARLFGARSRMGVGAFFALAWICLLAAGVTAGGGVVLVLGLLAAGAHLVWQVATLDPRDGGRALLLFRSNRDFGWIVFAAILLETALRALA